MEAFAAVAAAVAAIEFIALLGVLVSWKACESELRRRDAHLRHTLMERDVCRRLLRDVREVLSTPTPGGGDAAK